MRLVEQSTQVAERFQAMPKKNVYHELWLGQPSLVMQDLVNAIDKKTCEHVRSEFQLWHWNFWMRVCTSLHKIVAENLLPCHRWWVERSSYNNKEIIIVVKE